MIMSAAGLGSMTMPASGPQRLTAMTDESGAFALLADDPGEYHVHAQSSDGRLTLPNRSVAIPDADAYSVDLAYTGVPVTGIVIDGETEQPLANVTVGGRARDVFHAAFHFRRVHRCRRPLFTGARARGLFAQRAPRRLRDGDGRPDRGRRRRIGRPPRAGARRADHRTGARCRRPRHAWSLGRRPCGSPGTRERHQPDPARRLVPYRRPGGRYLCGDGAVGPGRVRVQPRASRRARTPSR